MLEPGTEVAGYVIEKVLGAGGMGVVYRVSNPELPRKDALKVLSPELSSDTEFRARFTREADVASQLDHPNITAIYRRGTTDDGQLWIAMQFVDGTDADAALRAGTMTPERAIHIVREVAKALDYAHQRGVVHRDVKPANFMLSGPPGVNERVLLGDFGIARALDDAGITGTGAVTATLAYAAPEVITGGRIDGRSDIYSLGCALYRMLTGKAPYHSEKNPAAIMGAHMQQPPPLVTAEVPTLPRGLDTVITRAMAKEPEQRYRTAGELAEAAAAALEGPLQSAQTQIAPVVRPTPPPPPVRPQYPAQPAYPQQPAYQQAPPSYQPAPQPAQSAYQPPSGGWPQQPASGAVPYPPSGGYQPQPYAGAGSGAVGAGNSGKNKGWIYAAIGGVVLLIAGGLGAGLLLAGGKDDNNADTPSTPTGPPVSSTQLTGLMLDTSTVASLVGATGMQVEKTRDSLYDASSIVSSSECRGVWLPAEREVYADSGWTSIHGERLKNTTHEDDHTHSVWQTVVLFPNAEFATKSFKEQKTEWEGCAGKSMTSSEDPPTTYTNEQLKTEDGVMSLRQMEEGGKGWGCDRALGTRNNVIVDVMVCRDAPSGQGAALAKAIIDKVPG